LNSAPSGKSTIFSDDVLTFPKSPQSGRATPAEVGPPPRWTPHQGTLRTESKTQSEDTHLEQFVPNERDRDFSDVPMLTSMDESQLIRIPSSNNGVTNVSLRAPSKDSGYGSGRGPDSHHSGLPRMPSQTSMTSSKARILAAEAFASRMREHRRSQRRSVGNNPTRKRSQSIDNSSVGSGREPVRRLSSGVSMRTPGSSASRQRSLRMGGFTASTAEARVRACLPRQGLAPPFTTRGRSSSEPRPNGLLQQSSKASL